jgi:hypothetical protein
MELKLPNMRKIFFYFRTPNGRNSFFFVLEKQQRGRFEGKMG